MLIRNRKKSTKCTWCRTWEINLTVQFISLPFTEASVALSGRVAVKNYISDSVDGILSNHILINHVIPSRQHLVATALFFSSDNVLKHTVCVLKAYPDRQKQCGIILAENEKKRRSTRHLKKSFECPPKTLDNYYWRNIKKYQESLANIV